MFINVNLIGSFTIHKSMYIQWLNGGNDFVVWSRTLIDKGWVSHETGLTLV